jgi:hypothetical protein
MKIDKIFVFDTNALISGHLIEGSVSDQAFKRGLQLGEIVISGPTMLGFVDVAWCTGKNSTSILRMSKLG